MSTQLPVKKTVAKKSVAKKSRIVPVRQESTPGLIADRVREAIGYGEFKPGEQLSEAALAARFGVSRGPLREGLQRLTQEGLLTSVRNRGLFVIEMTPENVDDMYLAREAIERQAARRILELDPAASGAALSAVVEKMARADAAGDMDGVSDADLEFHQTLVAEARSPRLDRIHQTLLTETRLCVFALGVTYQGRGFRVREHQAIADAIAAGDADLTDRLLVKHMIDAVERLS